MTAPAPKKAVLPPEQDQAQRALRKAMTMAAAVSTPNHSIQPTSLKLKMANTNQ